MCWTRTMLKKSWFPHGTGWSPSWILQKLSCDMAQPCHLLETQATPVTRFTPLSTLLGGSAWRHVRRPASALWKDAGKKKTKKKTSFVILLLQNYWSTGNCLVISDGRACLVLTYIKSINKKTRDSHIRGRLLNFAVAISMSPTVHVHKILWSTLYQSGSHFFCLCFVFVSGEQLPCWQLVRAWCRHGATSWTTPYHWCAPTMMSTLMCFLCWMCAHWNM